MKQKICRRSQLDGLTTTCPTRLIQNLLCDYTYMVSCMHVHVPVCVYISIHCAGYMIFHVLPNHGKPTIKQLKWYEVSEMSVHICTCVCSLLLSSEGREVVL